MSGVWHLDDLELLQGATEEELASIERSGRKERFDTGAVVFGPTLTPKSVYLLSEGAVRIYRVSDRGAEATLGYIQPGEVFGELTAVTGKSRESYAEATTPSVVWRIPIDLFRNLLGSRSGVGERICQQIGHRLKQVESRVEGLMFHDARLRLALILRELAEHFGIQKESEIEIDGEFTQAELATLVGCSRQTLNQCLGELEGQGLVRRMQRRIRLPKPESLSEFIEHATHSGG